MEDCYVEIDTNIFKSNIKKICDKYNDYKYYIAVVKGNAYGHGFDIIKYIKNTKINYFAVSTITEALSVRKLTDLPILCLQPIDISKIKLAQDNDITITISSYDYYKKLLKEKINIKAHLKLDTGMNRLGINNSDEVEEIYNNLLNNKHIKLEGIYTHLATLGIVDKKWDNQVNKFLELTKNIDLTKIKIVHIYSTNGLVMHPKLEFANGVRLGILMYGICPREINYEGFKGKLKLIKKKWLVRKHNISRVYENYNIDVKPCFKLLSRVVEIKNVSKDEYVGYGLKYRTQSACRIAVIPIGYADGLSLKNSGRHITINKNNYKIVGSVNMKLLTVEVDDKVKVGDIVTIIGDNVRYICGYTNVTPQNLFTSVPSNIERIYK